MLTVAYLANVFPCTVEPYVAEEIAELRARGVRVIAGSVKRPRAEGTVDSPEIVLQLVDLVTIVRAAGMMLSEWNRISPLIRRLIFQGREGISQRIKALLHTLLGVLYAAHLSGRGVDHVHVHHGYFGSWIAMTAAQLLEIPFSMTLHGSDLLVHANYLDVKLAHCKTCFTVSEHNRRYILDHYPMTDSRKVVVARLGVDVPDTFACEPTKGRTSRFTLIAVGRLHAVKNHSFLLRACAWLKDAGIDFECLIAGEGPERAHLEQLIQQLELERQVTLLGHVPRQQTASLYDRADVVVLTSRSEGIPLVLMEAMSRGGIVLAPAITGIPELVTHGVTGFLYEPGSMRGFVDRLCFIHSRLRAGHDQGDVKTGERSQPPLDWVRYGAHVQVLRNFHRERNLCFFADQLLQRITPRAENIPDENLVLQQI